MIKTLENEIEYHVYLVEELKAENLRIDAQAQKVLKTKYLSDAKNEIKRYIDDIEYNIALIEKYNGIIRELKHILKIYKGAKYEKTDNI